MITSLNKFFLFLIFLIPVSLITGPAIPDIIITISSIYFLIIYFFFNTKYDFNFINLPKWFLVAILFYLGANISSVLSNNNVSHSISSSIPYIRFIIFSFFFIYFILISPRNYFIIINIIGLSIFFVSVDICFQYFVGYDIFGFPSTPERNAGPFGDELKGGSYISKFYIPVFATFYFLSTKSKIYKNICIILFISCFMGLILSGERAAIILFLFSNLIFLFLIFFSNIKKLLYIIFGFILIILVLFNYVLTDKFRDRYLTSTFDDIKSFDNFIDSHYGAHYITAYNIFLDYPFLGVGQNNYRNLCSDKKYSSLNSLRIKDRCSTHPHNYYIQILSDLGILNFFIFVFLICTFFLKIFIHKKETHKIIFYGKLITLIVIFWPLLPTGSFYNNWLSVVNWLIISLSICKIDKNYSDKLLSFLK